MDMSFSGKIKATFDVSEGKTKSLKLPSIMI